MSDYEHIDYGDPQGSILGPILFIIYINSLNKELTQSKSIMYADDTILYGMDLSALQANINAPARWFSRNILTINPVKTKRMTFPPKKNVLATTPIMNIKGVKIGMLCNLNIWA